MKNSSRTRAKTQPAGGRLRIIGGQWRGRVLAFPAADGLRPTGDRLRETLFNWLQAEIYGARCLDLFAGSGALGLEALSRGAAHCTLLEFNRNACQQLRDNTRLLAAQGAQVQLCDTLEWLQQLPAQPFDVVFLDPPFSAGLWQRCIDALAQPGWLAPEAAVYVESPREVQLQTPQSWQLHREKRAGANCFRLYRISAQ